MSTPITPEQVRAALGDIGSDPRNLLRIAEAERAFMMLAFVEQARADCLKVTQVYDFFAGAHNPDVIVHKVTYEPHKNDDEAVPGSAPS